MNKFAFLLLFIILSSLQTFSQNHSLTKTTEYKNDKKRRDLFYDNNMNIVKEIYYNQSQKIINELIYDSSGNLSRFKSFDSYNSNLTLDVDFINGIYLCPEKEMKLKFKGDYIFDGLQIGQKIVVNYSNGNKNGVLIQTDSAISGKKIVQTQRLDVRYLKFNIFKYYSDTYLDDNYQLFNGVRLNFKNNLLEGKQSSFYLNGKNKFTSLFKKGVVLKHESFDDNGNIISKIIADSSGYVYKPIIKNGLINSFKDTVAILNENLSQIGDIVRENLLEKNWSSKFHSSDPIINLFEEASLETVNFISEIDNIDNGVVNIKNPLEIKKKFDENKYIAEDPNTLRIIFSIPLFDIKRLDFNKEEEFITIKKIETLDDSTLYNYVETLNKFTNSYNSNFDDILFLMDPYEYQENNINLRQKDGFIVRNLQSMPDHINSNRSVQNKKYIQSILRKTLYNILRFQNNLLGFIDPYETDAFGFRYKHSKLRIYYTYDEASNEGYACGGDCGYSMAPDLSIGLTSEKHPNKKNALILFREKMIWYFDNVKGKKYMQYFDSDGKSIIVKEFEIDEKGNIVFK